MIRTVVADGKGVTITGQAALTETLLKSVVVKAGSLDANGYLVIDIFVNNVAVAVNITMSLYFGGQGPFPLKVNSDGSAFATGNGGTGWIRAYILNTNSRLAQNMVGRSAITSGLAEDGVVVSNVKFTTTTLNVVSADTTQDAILKLTGSLGAAGDTINVRGWFVRAIRSDF